MNGSELLEHAHFALLPFLGVSTCNSLRTTCKQAFQTLDAYPHLSLLEGSSKYLDVDLHYTNKYYRNSSFDIHDFIVLRDGRIILYNGSLCVLIDKTIRPLRGRYIKQYSIPLGVQGISVKHNILFIAHGYTLQCYALDCGADLIEHKPILLNDDQDLDWKTQVLGCSVQEYYLHNFSLYDARKNVKLLDTTDAQVFCCFTQGFIFCGTQLQLFSKGKFTSFNILFDHPKQVQCTPCASQIYVLDSQGIWCVSTKGSIKPRCVRLKAKCMYLQTHLYYVSLDNKLCILH